MLAAQKSIIATEPEDQSWWADARCNDGAATMSGLFFSEELQDIARAKAICAVCPVLSECLEGAINRREPWGVWGGELFERGQVVARKRRPGRPRKDDHLDRRAAEAALQARLADLVRELDESAEGYGDEMSEADGTIGLGIPAQRDGAAA